MKAFGKFLLGFLFGAIVGGLVALLFSPGSGQDNQKKNQEYILMVQDETRKAGEEKADEMRTQLDKMRSGD
jgi:gas vesicle protein